MKVLITNLFIKEFTGSEINCLEISRCLKKMGHTPYIYTFLKAQPLLSAFEKEQIFVCDDYNEIINIEFDLIWNQHSQVLNYLLFKGIKYTNIIFSSLSPFEELEFPSFYVNQLPLVLSNSIETQNNLIKIGVNPDRIHVFLNSVDLDYFSPIEKKEVNKINVLCISNHPPQEIWELKNLENENFSIDFLGQSFNQYELVTPNLLKKYNTIISIGKTVQYAIALKIPIYCYDHFGGPGFLKTDNYQVALNNNFSGRGFSKKTCMEIYNELIYPKPIIEELSDLLYNKMNLRKNIGEVLEIVKHKSTPQITISDHQSSQFKKILKYYIEFQTTIKEKDRLIMNNQYIIDDHSWITNSKWWKLRGFLHSIFRNK